MVDPITGLLLIILSIMFIYISYNKYYFNNSIKNTLYDTFEFSGLTILSTALVAYGIYKGFTTRIISVDLFWISLELIWLNAVSASVIFSSIVALTGILLYYEVQKENSIEQIFDGDKITAIVPVYKDHSVLHRSVNSLKKSNYNNLSIKIACEPGDEMTISMAKELSKDRDNVEFIINQNPGSKSGAIETVVSNDDANYFAVFDADEIIDKEFISSGMGALCLEDYDVFQGRRIPEPTGIVESLAYCERVTYHASYKMVEITGFKNCRSSSTVFTRKAYDKVGGYDDMLTEDLAFAHKCYRKNISVKQSRNYTSRMEAPHNLIDFWGQRKRWRIGQVEVLHSTIMGDLIDESGYKRFISLSRIITSIIGSIILLVFISKLFVLFLLDAFVLYLVPILIVAGVATLVGYVDYRNEDIDSIFYIAICSPFVYLLFSVLMIKSIIEYVLSWDGSWYRVEKNG